MFDSWVGKIPWRRKWLTHSSILVYDIVSSNFLLVSCREITLSFPLLEDSRYQSK